MRQMFELMNVVGQQFADTVSNQIKNGGETSFEFRELSRKFTVDVIASCALGIEVNSFENPKNGKKSQRSPGLQLQRRHNFQNSTSLQLI